MSTLILKTLEETKKLTLKELTVYHNQLAAELGAKQVKRFSTKPKALDATITKNAEAHNAKEAEAHNAKEAEAHNAKSIVTVKEGLMLVKIAESEYTELNGNEPTNAQETATWGNCVLESKADGGVFASLLKKELVSSSAEHNTEDHTIALTLTGFEVYKQFKKAQKKAPAKTEKKAPTKKGSKSRLTGETILTLTGKEANPKTTRGIILASFNKDGTATVNQVVKYFLANFEQKRGLSDVNESFARGYINGSIRKGFIKLG